MRHFFSVIGLFLRYIKHYPKMKLLFWGSLAINSKLWYEHIYFTKFYKSTLNLRKTKQVCLYLQKLCHLSQYDCVHGKQGISVQQHYSIIGKPMQSAHKSKSHHTNLFSLWALQRMENHQRLTFRFDPVLYVTSSCQQAKNRSELYQ